MEQAARLLRRSDTHKEEQVTLLTSASPEKLNAQRWLELNWAGFGGIENGLHQRLDVSHDDDRSRSKSSPVMFVLGVLRRTSNSLFMEWRSHQPHPEHQTTTDFQSALEEDHCCPALRLVLIKNPSLKGLKPP